LSSSSSPLSSPESSGSPRPPSPAPDAVGGDPYDSGDDSGDDDEDNDNTDDEDPNEQEDDDPRYRGAEYHKHSTVDENIQFCVLVEEVLQHLGFTMKPFYVTKHYIEP
jgi:hypothetical protein